MLAYVTLGSNNKDKALEFYDAVIGELGGQRVFANDRLQFYGTGPGQPMIAIGGPYDGEAASVGNGVMPALGCKDTETVDRAYKKALEMGGPVKASRATACRPSMAPISATRTATRSASASWARSQPSAARKTSSVSFAKRRMFSGRSLRPVSKVVEISNRFGPTTAMQVWPAASP